MKSYITKILSLFTALCLILAFFAGCKDSDTKEKLPSSAAESTTEPSTLDKGADSSAAAPAKYENVDVYENADGNKAAKTESGEEVELTGESMQEIYAQYEKVRGTGSQEEKELLDKLQLILEAPRQ